MMATRIALFAMLFWGMGTGATQAGTVYVATVKGSINPAVADYLSKSIQEAEAAGANALVIQLNTPGGLLSSTKDIVTDILNAEIPVVVFVSPRGAWAGSAGTFITMAGHVAAMAPGTSIGAAHPVSVLPIPPTPPVDPTKGSQAPAAPARDIMGEKIENFTAAFIESIAEARDRNVEWAIDSVRNSVAIPQSEALEKNVIDLVADDLEHLLELIDGRVVKVGREERTLVTKGTGQVVLEMSWINRFFDVIADPQIALLLILAGLLGLYVEFTQPGTLAPGIIGVICLVLAGFALQILPFNWIGLALLLTGIGLLIAEIFVPSFGVLFVSGISCFAIGGYMIFDVPSESDLAVPFWEVVVPAVAVVACFSGLVAYGVTRTMMRPQFTGHESLIGQTALVDGDIDPRGRVLVHGELWAAESNTPLRRGEKVRIVAVQDLSLRVEPTGEENT